ncbi:MAG: response regulator [Cytophagales bacterium]|nr:MAG: response regulator [Cytophagales bacterium]
MSRTLLVIDDSKSILSVISYIFSSKYNVIKKTNGKDALDWMHSGNLPDVIVSDLNMPEMDGFEFLRHLKSSGLFEDIPLVVLSSNDNSVERIKCLKMGADDYLIKPFNPEELDARIQNIIKRTEKFLK